MYNHAPADYKCPICLGNQGVENDDTLLKQSDLVYKDDLVSAYINSFWIESVEGHVIVVPNAHYENIFDLPKEVGNRISEVVKKISIAMKKTYKCGGVTTRQNNEPAGNQHAFHYHHHVFPRYDGDLFNENMTKKSILSKPEERTNYAQKFKKYFEV